MLQVILAAVGSLANLLGVLKANGVNVGPIADEALKVVETTAVDVANYQAGQAVIIAHMSEGGIPGYVVAVSANGPAAQSLGL